MNTIKNKTLYQLLAKPLVIPDYQRDYAQGRLHDLKIQDTREKFVRDIISATNCEHPTHMGLVFGANNRGLNGFVAVDGQQRLTTCFLFHLYISKILGDDADKELQLRLRRFIWRNRIYTSEFIEFLFEFKMQSLQNSPNNLSDEFKKSMDYFSIWEKDPTVNNILTMLDEIHLQLKGTDINKFREMERNLVSPDCRLNFDYMQLESDTDEFQYQKMNSRGRDLTTYEHFKQKLQSESAITEKIKEKMDNKWLIFFDELIRKTHANVEADVFYQNYINETALWMGIKYNGEYLDKYIDQITQSKLKENRTDIAFVEFGAYKEFIDNISNVEEIIDWIANNYDSINEVTENFRYEDEKTKLSEIFSSATYQTRVVNYAICHYAKETNYTKLNNDSFSLWWRPIHNLIANTEIDKGNIAEIIKAIDSIPAMRIYEYLKKNSKIDSFSGYQIQEEQKKAKMCIENPELTKLFSAQEKREDFHGQIGVLLPDTDTVTHEEWNKIVKLYESLIGNNYRDKIEFKFIQAMLTFADDEDWNNIKNIQLKYKTGHLRGGRIPARWIHKMLFKYMEECYSPKSFFEACINKFLLSYETKSYDVQKKTSWIKYFLDNASECEDRFNNSGFGKIAWADGNLWLYKKKNKNSEDLILTNRRKVLIEKLIEKEMLQESFPDEHDVYSHYLANSNLKITFTPNRIWIGIPKCREVNIPSPLPPDIEESIAYKAWQWLPEDITNNFYESEDKKIEDYLENITIKLEELCNKFLKDLNII